MHVKPFWHRGLAGLAVTSLVLAGPTGQLAAQVRMYDGSQGGTSLGGSGSSSDLTRSSPSLAGTRRLGGDTPAAGGVRLGTAADAPAVPVVAPRRAVESMAPTVRAVPPVQPAATTAAHRPVIGTPVRATGLGSVLVFVKGSQIDGSLSSSLRKIATMPGLESTIFMHGEEPRALMAMAEGGQLKLPQDLSLSVDVDNRAAETYNAVGKNVIIYRDPTGVVRQYNLGSEFGSFLNHVQRLRSAS